MHISQKFPLGANHGGASVDTILYIILDSVIPEPRVKEHKYAPDRGLGIADMTSIVHLKHPSFPLESPKFTEFTLQLNHWNPLQDK